MRPSLVRAGGAGPDPQRRGGLIRPLPLGRRRKEGAARVGQRQAARREQIAREEVPGQAERVGDLRRVRCGRLAAAQEGGQRQPLLQGFIQRQAVSPIGN